VSNPRGPITVGLDIGTTAVKAVAVDEDGDVIARSRVPHRVLASAADQLRHDARRAWQAGPRKAFAEVTEQLGADGGGTVAGVAVASMVPSITAVNRRGTPMLPGLLYGDIEGRPPERPEGADPGFGGAMPDGEGFLRWAHTQMPDAKGYWPCQAVASYALCGIPAIDTGVLASLGPLGAMGGWNAPLIEGLGVKLDQLPRIVLMGGAAGTMPDSDTVVAGGAIDAVCDQVVSGAGEAGDVYAVFGATLIAWVITDAWVEAPGFISYPHTVPGRFLMGGPSNAGALFADWARLLLRGVPRPGPDREKLPARLGSPDHVPVWLPYVRGERTPFDDASLRSSLYGLDIATDGAALERAAYEASGFVIRRIMDAAGTPVQRVVASGGGSRVTAWMAAVADATGLPVEAVAYPDGGARGAAYLARMAAGLEGDLGGSSRWAKTGRRIDPDPAWVGPTAARYRRFCDLGTGA
jgi:xylulokinase